MKELESIKKEYGKTGFESGKIPALLMELREVYKSAGDPTLTKISRLAAEHIQANNDFSVDTFEEERSEGDETSFAYFLSLLEDADNKFNREEIQEYKQLLLEDLGY